MKKLLLLATVCAAIFGAQNALASDCSDKGEDHAKAEMKGAASAAADIAPASGTDAAQTPGIVEIALGNDDFSTLVAALQAGGLVGALQGEGPFTVFAPTNDAFAKLPEGTLESLLEPENKEKLQEILKYHVVASNVPSSAAIGNQVSLDTLAGKSLAVDGMNGVKINNANVTSADITASNGVIHIIDEVLIP